MMTLAVFACWLSGGMPTADYLLMFPYQPGFVFAGSTGCKVPQVHKV